MKYLNYLFGIFMLVMGVILIESFISDSPHKPFIQILNILILLSQSIYYIFFRKKKDVVIQGKKLMIVKGSSTLKEFDISRIKKIVIGTRSLKINFDNFSETFQYSQFYKSSINKLKAII